MGCCVATFEGDSNSVNSMAISADGSRLASASDDSTARLWDSRTGACIGILRGHSGAVQSVIFSPDGQRLASTSRATLRLWNSWKGDHIVTLVCHSDLIFSVAFPPDGLWLASASQDGTVESVYGIVEQGITLPPSMRVHLPSNP